MSLRIVVVGAGLAGLVCARQLHRNNIAVTVLEASDGIGGRVRTDERHGFLLDRGFQVLFTAYPAAKRQLDYARLDLRRYEPGAVICQGANRQILSDPLRDPASAISSVLTRIIPLRDKALTFQFTQEMRGTSLETLFDGPDETTEAFLRRYGFSERYLDNFLRPFFGGIFLSRDLQTSAKAFRFYWKMLSEGETVVPARGIGQIPWQLAEELTAAGKIHLNARVTELLRTSGGRCSGVRLADGKTFEADTVVLAVPAPEAARLTGIPTPTGHVGTVTLYFAGDAPVYSGRKLLLHANQNTFINNAAQISNIAPEQAPSGKHLLSASTIGVSEGDDDTLFALALKDLRRMLTGDAKGQDALATYQPLALYRIPYAQFAQPPGSHPTLPRNGTDIPGLYFAAEFTGGSSIHAALESGERAAEMILA